MTTKPFFNVLITSLSNKVPLVREVRKALQKIDADGLLFGADSNPACIGRYFADNFWEMPPTGRLDPADVVQYCMVNNIRSIIPTRDGELLFFAENRELLKDSGVAVMIAASAAVRTCLDKKDFYDKLENNRGINPIFTVEHPDPEYAERWVVKERFGAGSRNILIDVATEKAQSSTNRFESPIFQPYVEGQEYSIDLYVSQNATPKGCIVRTRDLVVYGESQVATTVDRPDIEKVCLEAAAIIGLTGHALFQIIEDRTRSLNMVECNCRFGGASSLSVAAGLDSFCWFFRESLGDDLADVPYVSRRPGLRQIRYAEDKVVLMA